jgi:hypothetical protein
MIRKSALKQWQPELMQGRSSGNFSSLTEGLGMGMAASGGLSSQAARGQRLTMRRLNEEGFLEKERLNNIGSFRLNQYNRPSTEVEDFKSPYLNDVAGYNQDTGVTVYDQQRSDKKEFNTNSLAYNSINTELGPQTAPPNRLFSNQKGVDKMFSALPEKRLEDNMMRI